MALLEKSQFPREKVCGDGLTPRATRQLIRLGIDTSERGRLAAQQGPAHLRRVDHAVRAALARAGRLPAVRAGPARAADFDDLLARNAVAAGAKLYELCNVTAPILDDRTDRIIGVTTKDGQEFRAPLVVAADGNSTRLSLAMGLAKRDDRPMGVAVRTYYRSPRHLDDHLESWLELWDGKPGQSDLLPGYGWIFGMGDGTCNVGLGVLNTSSAFGKTDYKDLLKRWLDNTPEEWGFRDENMTTKVSGCGAADGLQPHAALHQGPAAGRGRRRHGQPVQR